ncbi:MAG: 2-hydroxyacyl-CoA dehydratase [Desulfobacteraceae bacterium]|nr:2-hydroxyacyl-CoA dehydratase [Desulfobacteraceae bacterium]
MRLIKKKEKVFQKALDEYETELAELKERDDYVEEFDYFIRLLSFTLYPEKLGEALNKPVIGTLCIQAPVEIFHAFGVHPLKLCSGSFAMQQIAASSLPTLMCPMIKSCTGMLKLKQSSGNLLDTCIVPTTCDWIVKFPEMNAGMIKEIHFMELPRIKENERSQERWLEEMYGFKAYLEKHLDRKLKRKDLHASMQKHMKAWRLFNELIELKRKNLVSGFWSMVIANTFLFDDIDTWTRHVEILVGKYSGMEAVSAECKVLVAGSPIVFPNLKIISLIEEAGMTVAADDLCSGERIFPGAVCYDDPSLHGLLKALSQRYHKACICPVFADNEYRVNKLVNILQAHDIKGIVFHVLKGCHPYEIEGFTIEKKLKELGYKFIKIETDYVQEDKQNILTRLEAFKETL